MVGNRSILGTYVVDLNGTDIEETKRSLAREEGGFPTSSRKMTRIVGVIEKRCARV